MKHGQHIYHYGKYTIPEKVVEYYINGHLHNDSGPARILYNSDKIIVEEYHFNGLLHRDSGPAYIKRHMANGSKNIMMWYKHGKIHREDGPAIIHYNNVHTIVTKYKEEYRINGELHSIDDIPAKRFYNVNGKIKKECWYAFGIQHRETGPAEIIYDTDSGEIESMKYIRNGQIEKNEEGVF